jgi:hypothetical protein
MLAKIEAIISKQMIELSDSKETHKYIIFDVIPSQSRNHFSFYSKDEGILSYIDLKRLTMTSNELIKYNEGFDKYGLSGPISELQLNKKLGVFVKKNERIATIYSDDKNIINAIKIKSRKLQRIGYKKHFIQFRELIKSLSFIVNHSIRNNDPEMLKYMLDKLSSIVHLIILTKSDSLYEVKNEWHNVTLFNEDEAMFLEIFIFKQFEEIGKDIFRASNSQYEDSFGDFAEEIIKICKYHRLYWPIYLLLSVIGNIEKYLFENENYDSIKSLLIRKANIAAIFYSMEISKDDVQIRVDFQESLSKLISIANDNPKVRRALGNYFKSFEIMVCNMMVMKYFNSDKVIQCIKWLMELSDKNKLDKTITWYCLRSLYYIGALALSRQRFSIALEIAEVINTTAKNTGRTIENLNKIITSSKLDLEFSNKLWGYLFNPNTIMNDFSDYQIFIELLGPKTP